MRYILRAHKKQKESRATAATLEALLDSYEARCAKLKDSTAKIEERLEKGTPDEPRTT
ncbi:hypothetical protein ACPCK5_04950 [Streptomyces pseudogriseolus]|uniref:hypothetical protein n=1 Tax=Streptomyces pseudogriseolus TaxID=36817 RepID=UPI003FA2FD16